MATATSQDQLNGPKSAPKVKVGEVGDNNNNNNNNNHNPNLVSFPDLGAPI